MPHGKKIISKVTPVDVINEKDRLFQEWFEVLKIRVSDERVIKTKEFKVKYAHIKMHTEHFCELAFKKLRE